MVSTGNGPEIVDSFTFARRLDSANQLTDSGHGYEGVEPTYLVSADDRGLAFQSLTITKNWDGLWGWIKKRQQLYFMTVAFDLSGAPPTVMPPREVPKSAIYEVKTGETLEFTLGEGAPIFLPRIITGGLVVYILICESDGDIQHVGEVMTQVHEDLTADDGSIMKKITELIANPGKTMADEVLSAALAALQPIATILSKNKDEYAGMAQGVFKADSSWDGQLEQRWSGGRLVLKEI